MKKVKCIIVDDEALAQDLLEQYVQKVPHLQLVARCSSALEAAEILRNETVDLIFLDVEMPDLSGIDFLSTLSNPPKVIFTTAYSEYAVKGFELQAVDYLLKPITFPRFFLAVQRLEDTATPVESDVSGPNKIFVKADYKIVGITISDIRYVESMQKYVKIHHGDQVTIPLMSLSKMMEILPENQFLKVHKSYIVRLSAIDQIQGNMIHIGGETIPISKALRKSLIERIDQHKLL